MAAKAIGFLKLMCHDKPDIVASLCLASIGVIAAAVFTTTMYDRDLYHQHRYAYTVIRAEYADPVAKEKGVYN